MLERHYGALLDGAGADITRRIDAFDAEREQEEYSRREAYRPLLGRTGRGRPSALKEAVCRKNGQADGGIRTLDPRFTRAVLWPTELRRRAARV
jgi:hypothetical protein